MNQHIKRLLRLGLASRICRSRAVPGREDRRELRTRGGRQGANEERAVPHRITVRPVESAWGLGE